MRSLGRCCHTDVQARLQVADRALWRVFHERDSDTVSAYVTEAILYPCRFDGLYANRYKWVKGELLLHTLGGYLKRSDL